MYVCMYACMYICMHCVCVCDLICNKGPLLSNNCDAAILHKTVFVMF